MKPPYPRVGHLVFQRTPSLHWSFPRGQRIRWEDLSYPTTEDFELRVGYARGHGDIATHCHEDFVELVLVTNGKTVNSLEGNPYQVQKGSVFVIHPGQWHDYSCSRNLDLFNLCIRESALRQLPLRLLTTPGYLAFFQVEPAFRQKKSLTSQLILSGQTLEDVALSADRLRNVLADRDPLSSIRAQAIFTDLVAKLAIEYQALSSTQLKPVSLQFAKVISFIEMSYSEPITVADIAQHAGLSLRSLHRACLDYAGIPPKHLLTDVRLDHARQILAAGSESITEAAFAVGFTDSNHFSKCFKTRMGCSPREFRARHQDRRDP